MRQNYQARFLSRPGSRGRHWRTGLFHTLVRGGELRSDTYHTHTGIRMNPARVVGLHSFLAWCQWKAAKSTLLSSICVLEGNFFRYIDHLKLHWVILSHWWEQTELVQWWPQTNLAHAIPFGFSNGAEINLHTKRWLTDTNKWRKLN